LPTLLGTKFVKKFNLLPLTNGYTNLYRYLGVDGIRNWHFSKQ
jgi:hypothetical protein